MYKALKSAQHEIQEILLKFMDEVNIGSQTKLVPLPEAKSQAHDSDIQLTQIIQTLGFLHDKQNVQFKTIVDEIKILNQNITSIVSILMNQSVTTSTKIPSLQPPGDIADLKTIHVESSVHGDENNGVEVEEEAEAQPEVESEVEPEVEPETEVEPDQDETGVEVEEWTFRGRSFFKDSENNVYSNDNGEIGDKIGQYDPVKNVVKKLPTN
jgi:hypothetical protein